MTLIVRIVVVVVSAIVSLLVPNEMSVAVTLDLTQGPYIYDATACAAVLASRAN